MKIKTSNKKLLMQVVFTTTCILLTSLPNALLAKSSKQVETFYYEDATKTKIVGIDFLTCYGRIQKGQVTAYSTREELTCYRANPIK